MRGQYFNQVYAVENSPWNPKQMFATPIYFVEKYVRVCVSPVFADTDSRDCGVISKQNGPIISF